jgi:hypothetical protein
MPQIQDIFDRVILYPESLLTQHRCLLEADFAALGNGPTSHRLLWLANMDSAFAVASLVQLGSLTPQATTIFAENSRLPHRYLTLGARSRGIVGRDRCWCTH